MSYLKNKKEHLITKYYNPTFHRHIIPSYPTDFSYTKKYKDHEKRILEISVNEMMNGRENSSFHIEFIITNDASPVCWHMIMYSLEDRFKRWVYHHDPISFKTLEKINSWSPKTLEDADGFMDNLLRLVNNKSEFHRVSPAIEIRENQVHFVIYEQDTFHRIEIIDFPLSPLPPYDILRYMRKEIEIMQEDSELLQKQMFQLVKVIEKEYPSILVVSEVYKSLDECSKGKKVYPWPEFDHVYSIAMPFVIQYEDESLDKTQALIEITLLEKGNEHIFYMCSKDDLFLNLRTRYLTYQQLRDMLPTVFLDKSEGITHQKALHKAIYSVIKSVEVRPGRFHGELFIHGNGKSMFIITETVLYRKNTLFMLELIDLPLEELQRFFVGSYDSYKNLVVTYRPLIRSLMQNLEKIDPRLHFQLRQAIDSYVKVPQKQANKNTSASNKDQRWISKNQIHKQRQNYFKKLENTMKANSIYDTYFLPQYPPRKQS